MKIALNVLIFIDYNGYCFYFRHRIVLRHNIRIRLMFQKVLDFDIENIV